MIISTELHYSNTQDPNIEAPLPYGLYVHTDFCHAYVFCACSHAQ